MSPSEKERYLGFGLLGAAALLLIIAVIIGWSGVQRWRAVKALTWHQMARMSGNESEAHEAARSAAALGPDNAALVLPSIDLTAADGSELDRLYRAVPFAQRSLVDTVRAFHGALHGVAAGSSEGADGQLITHLLALAKAEGELPPFPTIATGDVPHGAILDRVAQAHMRAAWVDGNTAAMKDAAAILVLLRPDHADQAKLRPLLAAISGGKVGTVASFIHDIKDDRSAFLRQLALLAPEHAAEFIRLIPENERSAAEIQRMLLAGGGDGDLKQMVERAMQNPGEAVFVALFRRCLRENEIELAEKLAEKAPVSIKPGMEVALAFQRGDLATVAAAHKDRSDLKPMITAPFGRESRLMFHLATSSGLVPRTESLTIRINGERIAQNRVKRYGSLVEVEFRGVGVTVNLEVLLGDSIVHAGPVKL